MFAGAASAQANMSVPRHQAIVDAVAAGDPEIARQVVDVHMDEALTTLLDGLTKEGPRSA